MRLRYEVQIGDLVVAVDGDGCRSDVKEVHKIISEGTTMQVVEAIDSNCRSKRFRTISLQTANTLEILGKRLSDEIY